MGSASRAKQSRAAPSVSQHPGSVSQHAVRWFGAYPAGLLQPGGHRHPPDATKVFSLPLLPEVKPRAPKFSHGSGQQQLSLTLMGPRYGTWRVHQIA